MNHMISQMQLIRNYRLYIHNDRIEYVSSWLPRITYIIPLTSIALCSKVNCKTLKKSNAIFIRCVLANLHYSVGSFFFRNLENVNKAYQIISNLVEQKDYQIILDLVNRHDFD